MHTAGSQFSPQIGNCIQANNICPMTYIHEQDLDQYLDAGEATRSSAGGLFLDTMRTYQGFRRKVLKALLAGGRAGFDAEWDEATSDFATLESQARSAGGPKSDHPDPLWQSISDWMHPSPSQTSWQRFQSALDGQIQGTDSIDSLRQTAQAEADGHLAALRDELRRQDA